MYKCGEDFSFWQRGAEGGDAVASLTEVTLSQVTHRRPRKRAAGSAALASNGCARAGRACCKQWRDCYAEKTPAVVYGLDGI